MLKSKTVIRRGRTLNIQHQVVLWRKRSKRFQLLKKKLLEELLKAGFDKDSTLKWLETPQESLRNRTPKQLMNRKSIEVLYRWTRKFLRSSTPL